MEAHSFARSDGGLALPRSRKLLAAFGDERLVAQVRRGNEAAFEVLYDRHHAAVLSYCRHMLGSRDEAEDALQQAFVSAHGAIVSSEKPIRFKAWIYTIARNRCLSILRARRERPTDDLERISTAGLGDEVQQREDLKELLADMQELPEDQRAALILSELGDLSHAEVAEVIECEVAKVKSLVFQARSGLMERRQARETPCEEIREQIATLRGGALRRGPLRRHLKACPGCAEFREDVRRQRQMVAVLLPVVPTLGLKESALAAAGVSASTAGSGILAGGGAGAVFAAKAGVAKVAVVAVATTGAAGGAIAVEKKVGGGDSHRGGAHQSEKAREGGSGSATETPAMNGAATEGAGTRDKDGSLTLDGSAKGGDRAEKGQTNGFEPVKGEPNGERARELARGRGQHRGAGKQVARGGANPNAGAKSRKTRPDRPENAGSKSPNGGQSPNAGENPNAGPKPGPLGPLLTVPALDPPRGQSVTSQKDRRDIENERGRGKNQGDEPTEGTEVVEQL